MTQGLLFTSGTGTTRTEYEGPTIKTRSPESMRGSINVTLLRRMTRLLFDCHGSQKAPFRALLVTWLSKVRDAEECIDELLHLCASQGGPDGLDTAVDVLAKTKGLILEYAWAYLQRDLRNWRADSERAYKPSDDYWYVLLRAVGRTQADPKERYRFIACCATAASRGMREAVVLALRDLGTPAAQGRIRKFAAEDADPYVRQVAQEALEDLES